MGNYTCNDDAVSSIPRRLWHGLEPIHAVTYFAPACLDSFDQVGLAGFWMGDFAGREAMQPDRDGLTDAGIDLLLTLAESRPTSPG